MMRGAMRRLLTALVLTGTLALAGCSLLPFGNDDPTSGGSDGSGGRVRTAAGSGGEADDDAVVSGSGQLPAGCKINLVSVGRVF